MKAVQSKAAGEAVVIELVEVLRELGKGKRVHMDRTHGSQHCCPTCDADLMRVGIVELAYTFEVCECDRWNYSHLVEQMWHRKCLTLATSTEATS